jgi:hypothetical protein
VLFFETPTHLEYFCINNQAEYKAILLGLQILSSMDVKHVEAFSDSLLVVQELAGTYQCFNGSLNAYLGKCLKIIALFDDFTVHHISRDENTVVMFRFPKSDGPIFSQCMVLKSILLNPVQQNLMVRFQNSEGLEFPEVQTIYVK